MIRRWISCSETCLIFFKEVVSIKKVIQAEIKNGGKQITETVQNRYRGHVTVMVEGWVCFVADWNLEICSVGCDC